MCRMVWLAAAVALFLLAGCGKGGSDVRVSELVTFTSDAITQLLIGPNPNEAPTGNAQPDKPLLEKSKYESAIIAADAAGFHEVSQGTLTQDRMRQIEGKIVGEVNRRLKPAGFLARVGAFPPTTTDERTLLVTLVPATAPTGSVAERARGEGRTMILVRLTVTDPKTNDILAQRLFYSGADAGSPGKQQTNTF
jgi:hypothetical protein